MPEYNGIFVFGIGGGKPIQLVSSGHDPSWSPDGTHLVFASVRAPSRLHKRSSTASSLFDVDVVTHEITFLLGGNALQPRWSPDGRHVVFCSMNARESGILILDTRNRHVFPLISDAFVNWFPVWSNDGDSLYFLSNRSGRMSIWKLPASGGGSAVQEESTKNAQEIASFAIRPDGKLVYAEELGTLELFRVTQGSRRELVRDASGYRSPAVSPDGLKFAAVSQMSNLQDIFIFIFDSAGGRGESLTHFPANTQVGTPRWSQSSDYITFYAESDGHDEVWMSRPGERLVWRLGGLPKGGSFPVLSPDERRIAFTVRGESSSIAEIEIPNRSAHIVKKLNTLPNGVPFTAWSWSKDSTKLLGFAQLPDGTSRGVYVYDILLDRYTNLTSSGVYPIFRDDQKSFVFLDDGELFEVNLQSKARSRLLSMSPDKIAGGFDLSKDGTIYLNVFHGAILLFLDNQVSADIASVRK